MMMFGRLLLAAVLSFAAMPAVAQTKPKVVATFSILGDLVAQEAGDRIDLAVLVGADTDAHTYQPKPSDARTRSGKFCTSWPQISTVPAVGISSVAMMRMAVVLPAPFAPMKPTTCPCGTSKLTPCTAFTFAKIR